MGGIRSYVYLFFPNAEKRRTEKKDCSQQENTSTAHECDDIEAESFLNGPNFQTKFHKNLVIDRRL